MANLTLPSYNTIQSLSEQLKTMNIAYEKFNLKSKIKINNEDIIINSASLIDKYYDIILNNTQNVTLSDSDYIKYRYRPKSYCFDIYGTVELWSILLKINNWTSVAEFDAKTFKVMNSSIYNILNEIMILESEKIAINKENLE